MDKLEKLKVVISNRITKHKTIRQKKLSREADIESLACIIELQEILHIVEKESSASTGQIEVSCPKCEGKNTQIIYAESQCYCEDCENHFSA